MNWARGFIRLWVAFSALWIFGVSLSAYESWAALNEGMNLRKEREESRRFAEIDCLDPDARKKLTIGKCNLLVELSSRQFEHVRNLQQRQKSTIANHAKWGLGVVIATYLIGATIGWVLNGFRQKGASTTSAGFVGPPANSMRQALGDRSKAHGKAPR